MPFNDQQRQALLKTQHTLYFVLLKAHLGWSIKTKVTKFIISFIRNIAILCAKMSHVTWALTTNQQTSK